MTDSCTNLDIANRFKEMNLSVANSTSLAKSWLKRNNNCFYGYWDGEFLSEEKVNELQKNNILGKRIECSLNLPEDTVCKVSAFSLKTNFERFRKGHEAQLNWRAESPEKRSEILYKIAQTIKNFYDLFAEVEAISSGKELSRVKSMDINNLIDSFYINAGFALDHTYQVEKTVDETLLIVSDTFPDLSLVFRIASILAAQRSILAYVNYEYCLSALLLADICNIAGLPPNMFNVIPIQKDLNIPLINATTVLFCGSLNKAVSLIKNPDSFNLYSFIITKRPIVIVYESADLHSAAEGIMESFNLYGGNHINGGCKVLIQESIQDVFLKILKEKFLKLAPRNVVIDKSTNEDLFLHLEEAEKHAQIFKAESSTSDAVGTLQPMIISGLETGFKLVHEELGGSILLTITFRTLKESISMFNCDNKGSPVSIWTEVIPVALEVAEKLQSGTIWVNSQNIFDPSVPFSGVHSSGNTTAGGKELYSFSSYMDVTSDEGVELYKKEPHIPACNEKFLSIYKLYINGSLKQSNSEEVIVFRNSSLPCGNEADVQSAIAAAVAAQPKWQSQPLREKTELLLCIAKTIKIEENALIKELCKCDFSLEEAKKDVLKARNLVHHWAFEINKSNGEVKDVYNKKVLQVKVPLGVIAMNPSNKSLFGFFNILLPALAYGNTVVVLPCEYYPEPVLKMGELFRLACVPAGVINIISGPVQDLSEVFLKHKDINSLWISTFTYNEIKKNNFYENRILKRFHLWKSDICEYKRSEFEMMSSYTKSIYLTKGETFAN